MEQFDLNIKKKFYKIGEVAEILNVKPSLLRFWEKKFKIIKPLKNSKGTRFYTEQDIKNLELIYYLLKIKKMTIKGANYYLNKINKLESKENVLLINTLLKIRSFLLTILNDMKKEQ